MRGKTKRLLFSWLVLLMFFVNIVSPVTVALADYAPQQLDIGIAAEGTDDTNDTPADDPVDVGDLGLKGEPSTGEHEPEDSPAAEQLMQEETVPLGEGLPEGRDVTEILKSLLNLTVIQGGQPIAGNTIEAGKNFEVQGTFDPIPIGTDATVVQWGDFAMLELAEGFTCSWPAGKIDLQWGSIKLASLECKCQ